MSRFRWDGWDTHENNFARTRELLALVDPAFAMLLKELAERDLLEETIVLWLGEFGRTPKINNRDGRDHQYPGVVGCRRWRGDPRWAGHRKHK